MNSPKAETRRKTAEKKEVSSKQLAELIAKGAENKKALDIEIIDVRKNSAVCNYFVVCTADSSPQMNAIADGIEESLNKKNIKTPLVQGKGDSNWMVIDLINVIVHIMGKEERKKYGLEDLWGKSGIIYHV